MLYLWVLFVWLFTMIDSRPPINTGSRKFCGRWPKIKVFNPNNIIFFNIESLIQQDFKIHLYCKMYSAMLILAIACAYFPTNSRPSRSTFGLSRSPESSKERLLLLCVRCIPSCVVRLTFQFLDNYPSNQFQIWYEASFGQEENNL